MRAAAARAQFDDDKTTGAAISRRRRLAIAAAAALVTAALAALAPHGAALAQSTSSETRPCTEIDNDAQRLACYDRALRGTRDAEPAPAPAAAAPAPNPAPTSAAPTQPGSAGAPASAPAQSQVLNQPAREARAAAAAAPQTPAAPETRRGRHREREDKSDDNKIPVVIVKMAGHPGHNIFTTESGEIWTQTDGSTNNRWPSLPFRAQIEPGAIGSFFLIPSEGRAIRVHRDQ